MVRRWIWNVLRRIGIGDRARQFKGCRYALWKNPEDLTDRQAAKLAWIARHNHRLYRAYLLKEQLRLVFAHRGDEAVAMLDAWLGWARRSQIPAFIELYYRIKKHRAGIIASVTHGLSNGLTESVNTKLRLSPASPTGSAPPTTSSPSGCSTEAATAHPYPAGTDPRNGTESSNAGSAVDDPTVAAAWAMSAATASGCDT